MNVSLIGLGDMGHDIARHAVAGGFTVPGFDVDTGRRCIGHRYSRPPDQFCYQRESPRGDGCHR